MDHRIQKDSDSQHHLELGDLFPSTHSFVHRVSPSEKIYSAIAAPWETEKINA